MKNLFLTVMTAFTSVLPIFAQQIGVTSPGEDANTVKFDIQNI